MRYEGKLYRPPSEADSWILQATIGCSHNLCTYCDIYRDKRFRVRDLDEVLEDIAMAGRAYPCLLYTSPSPRDIEESRMPSSA